MKAAKQRIAYVSTCIAIASGLWLASQWWEKAWAKSDGDTEISPSGYYRLETFKPFWLLPSIFQPFPNPNEGMPQRWFKVWSYPGFLRLYINATDELVGESDIYDLGFAGGRTLWDELSGKAMVGLVSVSTKDMSRTPKNSLTLESK